MKDTASVYPSSNGFVEADDDDIDLSALVRTVIAVIKQNLVLIASIVAGVAILGIIATLLMTPKYQATSQILIEDQAEQIIEGSELQKAISSSETGRFLQTQLGVIRSRALALFIVQDAKLADDEAFFQAMGGSLPTEAQPGKKLADVREDAAVNLLLSALEVSIPPDSRIAAIRITSTSPKLSAKLANLYGERFIEYNLNQKYESSSYARKFLTSQLEEARAKLTQSERDLNQYARAAGLIRISSQGTGGQQDSTLSVTNNQLIDLTAATAAATAQRIAAEDRWKIISSRPALSISEVTGNSAVMQLITARTAAQGQLAEELAQHRDGYGTVTAKKAEIAELDKRISALTDTIKQSAYTDYQAALEKENSFISKVSGLRNTALEEQDRGVQYSVLKRVADTNRALYESLLSRFNQLNASAGSASNNVTIVDRAFVPVKPSSPNLILNIFLSLTLGLLIAAAVVALKHLLDDKISSPADIEKRLGLSLLGIIPMSKEADISQELANRRSSVSEAYRTLVTNLTYTTAKGFPPVLAVTSARAAEGKSTTSRALANDLARLGKKTLLVDADLRMPTLHRVIGDSSSGLTDVLIGEKTLDQVVHVSADNALLNYVTALPIPPDPSLLLAGDAFKKFLQASTERYDVVILDCPPMLGLSDVPLISQYTDGILLLVDGSKFNRGAIKATIDRLKFIKANVLGVALNRYVAKSNKDGYSYGDYYNYGTSEG